MLNRPLNLVSPARRAKPARVPNPPPTLRQGTCVPAMHLHHCLGVPLQFCFVFFTVPTQKQYVNTMGTHVSFIFRGYHPYIGGSKASFFMRLGSKGIYLARYTPEN